MLSTIKGIDVSVHNGSINWKQAKADGRVQFAILRAGYGKLLSQKDKQFENNYKGCKENNIPVGAYWYSYATTVSEAILEANVFLSVLKGKQFEYPVYMDVEEASQFKLGREKVSEIIDAFCSTVEKAGYWVGLYMSKSYLESFTTEYIRKRYAIWVAQYSQKCTYSGEYAIWQYGITNNQKFNTFKENKVSGISDECDMDYCYLDYPTIIKTAGLNGFTKSADTPETPKKTVEELAKEVLENKWGTGEERKARLVSAGYDYTTVQQAVNEMLKTSENTVEEKSDKDRTIHVTVKFEDGKEYSGTLTEED